VEQRIAWDDLPESLKQTIEARTGSIVGVRIATAGQNSPLAAILDTSDGKVFVKGMPSSHRRVISQTREAAVAPLVKEISPWALSEIKVPDDSGLFKRAGDRWKPYVDNPASASTFAGPVLTHSDWTPDNVLVSEDRTWLIDWAWSTLAPPGPTQPAGYYGSWPPAATPRPRPNDKPPASRPSGPRARRTLTCSPPQTSGCGMRSPSPARAPGRRTWHTPRTHGLPTARPGEVGDGGA